MQGRTAIKVAILIAVVCLVGSLIALRLGAPMISIAEQVGYVWVLAAMFLLQPIVTALFPTRLPQIALALALASALIGALCIVHYSTKHIALSLSSVAIFWQISEGLLMRRGWLLGKTQRELLEHFQASLAKPQPPMSKVLRRGSWALALASIICLFTLTTW